MPWLICGDFNALLYSQDRLYGNPVQFTEVKEFNDCMQDLSLTELNWRGDYYTWSNKQHGDERICSRLDRAIGNFEWMLNWGHLTLEYGVPNVSSTMQHQSFIPTVQATWAQQSSTGPMRKIWHKLKILKPALKKLNAEEFKTVTQKISQARTDLAVTQEMLITHWSDDLQQEEKLIL
ncbi:uncharacterized protein LOC132031905 [Lycium ferocissimum]|uniref:uncharacterized protein LOC132031905 n=1 Tax=Lycium ferocissimum TaxID=112874 RepID=UPI002815BC31|nr:uncharacterized protein LOC132031905 [Lycium ferocissimum]